MGCASQSARSPRASSPRRRRILETAALHASLRATQLLAGTTGLTATTPGGMRACARGAARTHGVATVAATWRATRRRAAWTLETARLRRTPTMIQTGSKLTPGVHELPHGGDRYSRLLSQPCYVRVGEVGYDFSLLARGMVAPLKLSGTADPLDMKRFKQFKSMVPTLEYVHFSLCRDSHVTCGEV